MATSSGSRAHDLFRPPRCPLTGDQPRLDRGALTKTVHLPAVRFDKRLTGPCLKALRRLSAPRKHLRLRSSGPEDPDEKVLLLDPDLVSADDPASLGEQGLEFLRQHGLEGKFGHYPLAMGYEDWSSEEVLGSLLPQGVEVPTGFSRVGHIIHLNLRPEHLKYKHVIGRSVSQL